MQLKSFALLAVFLFAALPGAGDANLDNATLKGMMAVRVVIDPIQTELEQIGLSIEQMKILIEERLRSQGISLDENANEFLGLIVSSDQFKKKPYALQVQLGLYQVVILSRDKNIKTVAQTWEGHDTLIVQPKHIKKMLPDMITNVVDQFSKAYLAANPK
jgi:hypothetical protein